jgi:hypothetical protein
MVFRVPNWSALCDRCPSTLITVVESSTHIGGGFCGLGIEFATTNTPLLSKAPVQSTQMRHTPPQPIAVLTSLRSSSLARRCLVVLTPFAGRPSPLTSRSPFSRPRTVRTHSPARATKNHTQLRTTIQSPSVAVRTARRGRGASPGAGRPGRRRQCRPGGRRRRRVFAARRRFPPRIRG